MKETTTRAAYTQACFIGSLVLLLAVGFELREALADERPTNPDIGSNTFELLSYQDSGYRFKIIGPNEKPPSGFEQPGFDETGFDIGNAAFGGGGGGAIGGGDCPLRATVQTPWPLESQLLVRRVVSIPAGATGVRVMVSVDNDIVGVFFNGTPIADFISHGECPVRDEFRFDVPQSLVQPGENLVAFHVLDRPGAQGNESFFDTRILAELAPDELAKALHELAATVDRRLPFVPVSDISVDCPSTNSSPSSSSGTDQQVGDQHTSIRFLVNVTGEAGEIKIVQPAPLTFTAKFFLDGKLMFSTTHDPQAAQFSFSPSFLERPANDGLDLGVMALDSVLAREEVTTPLFECLKPRGAESGSLAARGKEEECMQTCASAGRTGRGLCWGGVGATAAIGAGIGSLGGLFGAALGTLVGGVADGFAGSLCSDDIGTLQQDCERRCTPP